MIYIKYILKKILYENIYDSILNDITNILTSNFDLNKIKLLSMRKKN